MTSLKRLTVAGAATVLVVGAASVLAAQTMGMGQRAASMYDVTTETTIVGTIERIETVTGTGCPGCAGWGGTHVVVNTEKEPITVLMGPTRYLAEKAITFANGDSVEVLGSRVTINSQPVLIARQIKKGDDTWTLRDESGRPLWSGRGRGWMHW
jgi:hypothetical protein